MAEVGGGRRSAGRDERGGCESGFEPDRHDVLQNLRSPPPNAAAQAMVSVRDTAFYAGPDAALRGTASQRSDAQNRWMRLQASSSVSSAVA
ncbi:hypothetical protein GCM10008170_17580 [Methylopila capsulata]|uniref:Uncharacterized protein n=1 Tax=Methylopila capsulata TaxID=61654 RepID=A0A9W6MS03_9HYPH|nr:hypothetical protein GCM10008170_17580 [Methylopila capsulata]